MRRLSRSTAPEFCLTPPDQQASLPSGNLLQPDLMNKGQITGWVRIHGAGRLSDTGSQKEAHLAKRGSPSRISTLRATEHACALRRSQRTCPQPCLPSAGEAGKGLWASSRRDRPADRGVAKRPGLMVPTPLAGGGVSRSWRPEGRAYCPFNHPKTLFKPTQCPSWPLLFPADTGSLKT